jgi:NAD(P)-dependent dehydrogenase (short-subunit alcohol dehydrogenase family)
MGWLDGQVALITGGGSGLGRALVGRFLDEGARVGVLDISAAKCAALRDELGDRVSVTQGDVADAEDNERAVADTVERFGSLDTLVANAGIWDYGTSLTDLPPGAAGAAFDELFGVNVKGPLLGARAAVDALRSARGSIIMTISNAGFYPGGGGPLYTASKHALVGLVRQLAYELCPEVRVNAVAPGGMATDLRGPRALGLQDTSFGAVMPVEEMMERIGPLEVRIKPADYTGAYVLLASRDNSRATTGSIINTDGGVGIRGRREMERMRRETMEVGASA